MSDTFSNLNIDTIRTSSRNLVRELGFMGGDFAGTDLPPSAVHALIEIEGGDISARDLAALLHLDKSSVSRMIRKLVEADFLKETVGSDGRVKILSLTPAGKKKVSHIHDFARAQVSGALEFLNPKQVRTVLDGLHLYSTALAGRVGEQGDVSFEIVRGYRTGLIARITEMHARYYAATSGFGQRFESVVAAGLSEFCGRLERPVNDVWLAVRDNEILASIAIDGEDLGAGVGHLRWFIVDDSLRGTGVGRKLLNAALTFADQQLFSETHLWTFSGLHAARHLYETCGFKLVEEKLGSQWGKEVVEQRFVRCGEI